MNKELNHYEESVIIHASLGDIFAYADNPMNFSSHMNKSSMMMGGGKMDTKTDDHQGQAVGSHIQMTGSAFGIPLSLDEVVSTHNPPFDKTWETVGDVNLLVIDHYKMGFILKSEQSGESSLRVFIDYNLPKSLRTRLLGLLFSKLYAKWCVRQMTSGVGDHFKKENA